MGTPKQRRTRSARGQRRSHHAFKAIKLAKCGKCGKPVLPHQLCLHCGTYSNREVIDVMAKLTKKERKIAEREKRLREREQKSKNETKPLNPEELSKK